MKVKQSTSQSGLLFKRACKVIAGGTTRTSVFFEPYARYIKEGKGARIWDVDGNEYVDFLNNYTTLIHGHAFAPVVEAIQRQASLGSCFAAPTENEIRLAEIICERVPSVEQIRFCSSGTEAVMFAVRLARAFTERPLVAKFEGGFHGTYDDVYVSHKRSLDELGPVSEPACIPESAGINADISKRTLVLPFNYLKETRELIKRFKHDLACVIIEPVIGAGGIIPARKEFLQALREITAECNVILIFDEIMSFRLGYGGAQGLYEIAPDLTVFGKIISGGVPLAAFGGRRDMMSLLDPRLGKPKVLQSGTFNGSAIATAAGVAAMEYWTREGIEYVNSLGKKLKNGLGEVFRRNRLKAQVSGFGSLFNIHFNSDEIVDYRIAARSDVGKSEKLFYGLLEQGYFIAPRGMLCLSSVMKDEDINGLIQAVDEVLDRSVKT